MCWVGLWFQADQCHSSALRSNTYHLLPHCTMEKGQVTETTAGIETGQPATYGMLERWRVADGGKMFWKFLEPGFLKRWSGEFP